MAIFFFQFVEGHIPRKMGERFWKNKMQKEIRLNQERMSLQLIISGLVSPTVLTSLPGGFGETESLYVADQVGIVYRYQANQLTPFLDLRNRIIPLNPQYDERGLLGFVFSPYYLGGDMRVFVYYSAPPSTSTPGPDGRPVTHENRLSEINMNTGQETILLRFPKHYVNHNGGRLVFGPDNYLYVSVGDSGGAYDPYDYAQSLFVYYGKILRLDVSRPGMYSIPPDNPFVGQYFARPEIYAYGFRNPWSLTFDSQGRLFCGDVGQDRIEEINIVSKGGNYGWPIFEGTQRTHKTQSFDMRITFIPPIFEYTHEDMKSVSPHSQVVAIIGGYYVPSVGYVFGDYGGVIMVIEQYQNRWVFRGRVPINTYIRAFGQDSLGNIYLLTAQTLGPSGLTGQVSLLQLK
jgi:glucose/arabinose dehydrogenase